MAGFTVATTNLTPPLPNNRSCEGREVNFTNTSSPMTNIIKNVWDFGDGTSLHDVNAVRVYDIVNPIPPNESKLVTLAVTDKYGCSNFKTVSITIDNNKLSAMDNPDAYTLDQVTPCYGTIVNVEVNVNGGTPTNYEWYKEMLLTGSPSANNIDVSDQGAYWVQLQDAQYCYKNINPMPAIVSFQYPVQATITGKQDACAYEPFTLKAPAGTGLTYSWTRIPTGSVISTSQTITENLAAGTYTYTLTVSQAGGCSSTSAPYQVTVHNFPQAPTTSLSVIDCNSYTLQLNAYSGITSDFTWSDGQSGATIEVTHGGPYRVWLTDQYGCKSHADIDVPFAPSTHFWRFPTGCYSYCPGELPKWVDAPSHVSFERWKWEINGNIVNPNNGLGGSGGNSICAPLWLNHPPTGSGSGDYTWTLDNGLCKQESGIMSVEMKEKCCRIEKLDVKIVCDKATGNYVIGLDMDNNTPGCNNAFYNIYVLDPVTMQSIASIATQTPATIQPGYNHITATFPVTAAFATSTTPAVIKIEVFCNSWEHCIGYIDTKIPDCKYKSTEAMPLQAESEEATYISELNILPNPANTEVNISYRFANDNAANSRSIQVYDAIGRPVTEIKIGNSMGLYNLNVSNYAQGIYFVEIRENNQHILIKRILINH